MTRLSVALCILLGASCAHAAGSTVRVRAKPSAVFTPTAGGYILAQPGPSLNLSRIPQPVMPSSGGIKGTGAFSGGKKFRIQATTFEMGGEYDMPIPKTNQKATVTAVSVVPKAPLVKSLLKALPVVGNVMAVAAVLDAIKDEWDQESPPENGEVTFVDSEKGEVKRESFEQQYEFGGRTGPNPSALCNAAFKHTEQTSSGPVERTAYAMDVNGAKMCMYSHLTPETLGGYLGLVNELPPIAKKELAPESVLDSLGPKLSPSLMEELLNFIQNHPKVDQVPFDLPSDLPTTVTGPSEVPNSTTTRQNSDGITTKTETKTALSYDESKIIVDQTTTVTKTGPDGEVISTEQETVTGETPVPIPNQSPNPSDSSSPNPKIDPETGEPIPQEIDLDICKLNPDILACKKLDPPEEGEIPKEDRDITLQTGPTFGGGACIPNVTVQVFGTTITALNFTEPCRWLSDYLKPLLLLMASISAVFIVLPRES